MCGIMAWKYSSFIQYVYVCTNTSLSLVYIHTIFFKVVGNFKLLFLHTVFGNLQTYTGYDSHSIFPVSKLNAKVALLQ